MWMNHLISAIQITLTGFFIYRVWRFLNFHRTWELAALLAAFILLVIVDLQAPEAGIHRWLFGALTVAIVLTALEPELAGFGNAAAESLNPNSLRRKKGILSEVAHAAKALAITKTGALIAFERKDSLLKFGDTGIQINADIKKELLTTLFAKDTPTHDGGILIRRGRVSHCGAVFPLSEKIQIENGLGTRHRAALGLSEKTDAVCLIVSEEEGTISLAKQGELIYSVPPRELEEKLRKLLREKNGPKYYPLHYLKYFRIKLGQPNYIHLAKSLGKKGYDLLVIAFWWSALIFWNHSGEPNPLFSQNPMTILLLKPWSFAPLALLTLGVLTFFCNQHLVISGVMNQGKREYRFLFFPLFYKRFRAEEFKSIILRRERTGADLWSLGLANKKRKHIPIDKGSAPKALLDTAKKIRDVLRIELVTHP